MMEHACNFDGEMEHDYNFDWEMEEHACNLMDDACNFCSVYFLDLKISCHNSFRIIIFFFISEIDLGT